MAEKKEFLNPAEQKTKDHLDKWISDKGLILASKTRFREILEFDKNELNKHEREYYFNAHLDFVLLKDNEALLVVEFDGKSHSESDDTKRRDKLKNKLCKIGKIPIIRVNFSHIYYEFADYTILRWFIETLLAQREIEEAQIRGDLPQDEYIDVFSTFPLSNPIDGEINNLSLNRRTKLVDLAKEKEILDPIPNIWIGTSEDGRYHGIGWIKEDHHFGLLSEISIYAQDFPVRAALITEIIVIKLHEEFQISRKNIRNKFLVNDIEKKFKNYEKTYKLASCSGRFDF